MKRDKGIMGALAGFGAGMAAMYFLDPDRGARRRAIAADKVSRAGRTLPRAVRVTRQDLANRSRGMLAGARHLIKSNQDISDAVTVDRIRSNMGRVISHPHAVHVTARNGEITLSGMILTDEVPALLKCVRSVPGVTGVENNLQAYDSPEGVPSLQGGKRREHRWEFFQQNWSPAARFAAGTAATAALAYGLAKRGAVRRGVGAAGAALLARSVTNTDFQRLFGLAGGRTAVTIDKTINVQAPPDVLFALWSNFANFPRFMSNVLEVKDLGEGVSHWKVSGPGGVPAEWDAEITKVVPNEMIAWKSLKGSAFANAGYAKFEPNPDGTTKVSVRMSYNPPAVAAGQAAATALRSDPKAAMDADLMRMKSLLETGSIPQDAAQEISNRRSRQVH